MIQGLGGFLLFPWVVGTVVKVLDVWQVQIRMEIKII